MVSFLSCFIIYIVSYRIVSYVIVLSSFFAYSKELPQNYLILGEGYISPNLFVARDNAKIIRESEIKKYNLNKANKIYASSEQAVCAVLPYLDKEKSNLIKSFSDKLMFRKLLKNFYPSFYFQQVNLENLKNINLNFDNKKYVLKPSKGFFGIGIRILDSKTDLNLIQKEIEKEQHLYGDVFGKKVINFQSLIIEDFLETAPYKPFENEEIAVDMFYDKNGKPIITGIYLHPVALKKEYSNLLYYTKKDLYKIFEDKLMDFFLLLKNLLPTLNNFPLHAEFKVMENQTIYPIEINPLRFGGFGLADLPFYAFNYNPILGFFNDEGINLVDDFPEKEIYSWTLAYNPDKIQDIVVEPNYNKFEEFIGKSNILFMNLVNHQKYPVFAVSYIKSSEDFISKYLKIDFNKFQNPKI